jgi:hypothetical protein
MHPRHAEVQRMRFGESADTQESGDHRHPGALGEQAQLGIGTGQHDPVAGHDERALGPGD